MARHTPIPWFVSRDNAGAIPKHFRPPIVLGRGGESCVASNLGSGPEAEANGILIAAAPEMLAVLKRLVAWSSELGGWDAPCWADAEEVIAKAEGRKS